MSPVEEDERFPQVDPFTGIPVQAGAQSFPPKTEADWLVSAFEPGCLMKISLKQKRAY